jgi:DhnA family fructose-bisphosphate aldolase class Ia
MINGKQVRKRRLLSEKGSIFLALDHGFSMGPIKGIENLSHAVSELCKADIDSVILNYGALKNLEKDSLGNCRVPIMVHLTGNEITGGGVNKNILYSPMDAIKLGADAVSFQINFGTDTEQEQIKQVSHAISQSDNLGLPVLLMMYDKSNVKDYAGKLKQMVRLGIEIGADILKIDVKDDSSLLKQICSISPIPVVVAGGALEDNSKFIVKIKSYLNSGAAGISVGRNIFQNERPLEYLNKVCEIIHGKEK